MKKRVKKAILLIMAVVMTVTALPLTMLTALALPSDEYPNLVVKSTPRGKIGRSMNITFSIRNSSDSEDWEDVYVSIQDNYYSMSPPGSEQLDYVFPFEVVDSTFKKKYVGKVAQGKEKSVSLTARVRKDTIQFPLRFPGGKTAAASISET